MKNLLMLLIVASFSCAACAQNQEAGKGTIAKDLSVQEFNKKMKERPGTLLDVRTKGEIAKGAIPGHTSIDFFDEAFEEKIEKLDKSKPVYVYCASGGRSGEAMELMQKKGFSEIYNLDGGYSAWSKAMKK
jgi:rhodanese-related sulfurtransferase